MSIGMLVATSTADAHHGFTGRYDRSTPIYIDGVVRQASFSYPHAILQVEVDPSAVPKVLPSSAQEFTAGLSLLQAQPGTVATVELPPIRIFFDLERKVRPNERIRLIVLRNCLAPHQLRAQWVAPSIGDPVVRQSSVQTEIQGC
jgi:hypothetical protein